jgi:hypothetical protein
MKNLLNKQEHEHILARIDALQGDERAQWGTMTADQMVCHVTDQIRMALGDIPVADCSNFITRTLASRLVLLGLPAPKGKVKTAPEIDTKKQGTQPTTFEQDIAALKHKITELLQSDAGFAFQPNPFFGPLTRQQWGRLCYLHLDHHLRQFGR